MIETTSNRSCPTKGKSLSVICSALQWLKDAEAKDVDGNSTTDNDKGPSTAKKNGGACRSATADK